MLKKSGSLSGASVSFNWFVLLVLFIWLNQTNQMNQRDQIDQTNQIDQMNQISRYFAEGQRAHQDARRPCPHEERLT